jgi:glycosyltransferase involved in cell wall biosynthesis
VSVSLIIPTRDRRALLCRALASVRAQTVPPDEIIVVDDGSRDGTAEMLLRDFPEVTVIRQDNAGVSAARNRGIERATGDWIALLDSDDEWLPVKLERQLAAVGASREALLCHTDEIWIRRGVRVNPRDRHVKRGGLIFEHCLPLCCISPSSALLRRDLLDEIGRFDESLPACEDYDLWLRVCARHPVLLVDEPLVIKHGGHDDQLSRSIWGLDRFRVRALQKILVDGGLSRTQRAAARRMLEHKVQIVAAGAAKRGRHELAARYRAALRPGATPIRPDAGKTDLGPPRI